MLEVVKITHNTLLSILELTQRGGRSPRNPLPAHNGNHHPHSTTNRRVREGTASIYQDPAGGSDNVTKGKYAYTHSGFAL